MKKQIYVIDALLIISTLSFEIVYLKAKIIKQARNNNVPVINFNLLNRRYKRCTDIPQINTIILCT